MTGPKPDLTSLSETTASEELDRLRRRLRREKQARLEAESLLEQKSSELFDASEKLKAESARAQALAAAVETAKDGLALAGPDGSFLYMNAAHAEMFGYTIDEMIGEQWSVLYRPEIIKFISEKAMPVLTTLGSWRGELEGLAKDGAPVFQEVVLTLREDGGLICATRNIGERLQRERDARELEARLIEAEREAALFTVGNAVAHDFNNLIAAISGYALLLQSDLEEGTETHQRAGRILEAAEQASGVVRSLEVERNNDVRSLEEIDLTRLMQTGLAISEAIRPRGIELDVILPDHAVAECNEVLLSRALINIAKNAFEAMGGSGVLKVRLGTSATSHFKGESFSYAIGSPDRAAHLVLELSDTGPGIPREKLESIFEPFTTTKRAMRGSGLGLLSLKALAETQAVSVEVESCPGEGTCFRLRFLIPSRNNVRSVPKPPSSRQSHTGLRILVVDDNASVGQMLAETLRRQGFVAIWKEDPIDALQLIEASPDSFDILLTDLTMPNLAGDELARRAKAVSGNLPVILYSGQSGYVPDDPIYSDILTKPISPDRLTAAIVAAMESQSDDPE